MLLAYQGTEHVVRVLRVTNLFLPGWDGGRGEREGGGREEGEGEGREGRGRKGNEVICLNEDIICVLKMKVCTT